MNTAVNAIDQSGMALASFLHTRSLSQAARELGVTKQAVSQWRSGKVRAPRMAVLFAAYLMREPQELSAGLPGAPLCVQDATTAPIARQVPTSTVRIAKRRRRRNPAS